MDSPANDYMSNEAGLLMQTDAGVEELGNDNLCAEWDPGAGVYAGL